MTDQPALPYRPNVGALLFNRQGMVLVARRTDMPGAGGPPDQGVWQCPQGGIDEGETPETAVLRELGEEIGTDAAQIIAAYPQWLSYDLPAHLIGRALGGRYRGQRQQWFALRFTGQDTDIRLDTHQPAEFDLWKWVGLAQLPLLNVGIKKEIYTTLATYFAPYATAA
ncbi:RNA pyrophosphohydrolase [Komagataeibacter sp. FNDCR2]|uniref:RNA pyrophosphohydrolase n=1 Tax=Komagataeibacter sp. FNDCR2 TaxID=2878682 RepID=UPI001E4954A2|nr:RNA pyrophosphohydrolase [Komagataeibacter sp. FNDCR2]MCE2575007.1 RNA pyrophosphohydrolase [Komagataeibacter sp. FNDCR2]